MANSSKSNPKTALKSALSNYISERVISEVAVEARVLFLTRLPNLIFPSRWLQFRKARQLTGIKVNIGCGPFLHPGWVGIDYRAPNAFRCDVKRKLPFQDGACKFIFSEHVFEHLDLQELHRVLCECYRVLEPGGVLRVITPDLRKYAEAYTGQDETFSQTVFDGRLHEAQMLNKVFHLVTHRFIHDFSSLKAAMSAAGFSQVEESSFKGSAYPELNIDCDVPSRVAESLYVDAIKAKENI